MPDSLVERATSDLLIGSDWAMNLEICEILNHDPGQAKDVVRSLKRRIGHKNPKIQLLALTLLETIIRNCGDIVHMHVADRDLPHKMVKLLKKKADFRVKEKILILIDAWQEAFGGPHARYPQYYAAYQELLRAGVVFPRRTERPPPILSRKHKRSSSDQTSDHGQEAPESASSIFPALSLTEIQTARGIMDILSDMLNALDPGNTEELRQEVILDLVEQCHSYKQRLVHFVNTTSEEVLLCQGLALNDDLQRVLSKYDTLAAGTAVRVEKKRSLQALVDIDNDDGVTNPDNTQPGHRHGTSLSNHLPLEQLLLPATPSSNTTAIHSARAGAHFDLLSDEYISKPAAENSLALVPVSETLASSANEQNALVLANSSSQNSSSFSENSTALTHSSASQPALYFNGSIQNVSQYDPSAYYQGVALNHAYSEWNGQVAPSLDPQPPPPLNGANDHSFPPPPWETECVESSPDASPYIQSMHPGYVQSNQHGGIYPQPTQSNQQYGMYSSPMQGGQSTGYFAYNQQPQQPHYYNQRPQYPINTNPNEISQGMYGLSVQDGGSYATQGRSHHSPSSSHVQQFNRPSRPEDKLFGDLVIIAKSKPKKPTDTPAGNL